MMMLNQSLYLTVKGYLVLLLDLVLQLNTPRMLNVKKELPHNIICSVPRTPRLMDVMKQELPPNIICSVPRIPRLMGVKMMFNPNL